MTEAAKQYAHVHIHHVADDGTITVLNRLTGDNDAARGAPPDRIEQETERVLTLAHGMVQSWNRTLDRGVARVVRVADPRSYIPGSSSQHRAGYTARRKYY